MLVNQMMELSKGEFLHNFFFRTVPSAISETHKYHWATFPNFVLCFQDLINLLSYDDIWDGTSKKSGNDFQQKMAILTSGFDRYMKEYFYEAKVKFLNYQTKVSECHFEVSALAFKDKMPKCNFVPSQIFQSVGKIQGCDGSKAIGTKRRGIHYKQKRYGRKMIKTLYKIGRRKPITRQAKKALENQN